MERIASTDQAGAEADSGPDDEEIAAMLAVALDRACVILEEWWITPFIPSSNGENREGAIETG